MLETVAISLTITAFLFFCAACVYAITVLRGDARHLRETLAHLGDLHQQKHAAERIEQLTLKVEDALLKVSALAGEVGAIDQKLSSHLQRYYRLQREDEGSKEERVRAELARELEYADGNGEAVEQVNGVSSITRKLGW